MATPKKSKAKLPKSNSTGYLGVTLSKTSGRYIATYKGKKIPGGARFDKAIDAAKARDAHAIKVDGDKAVLNFPA